MNDHLMEPFDKCHLTKVKAKNLALPLGAKYECNKTIVQLYQNDAKFFPQSDRKLKSPL